MIETTARILIGIIIGVAVCVALTIALCVDLLAPETRPSVRRARSDVNAAGAWSAERPRVQSMSEAHT